MDSIQFAAPIGRFKATPQRMERMIRNLGFEIRHYAHLAARILETTSYISGRAVPGASGASNSTLPLGITVRAQLVRRDDLG
jgi:hypothetical protein